MTNQPQKDAEKIRELLLDFERNQLPGKALAALFQVVDDQLNILYQKQQPENQPDSPNESPGLKK